MGNQAARVALMKVMRRMYMRKAIVMHLATSQEGETTTSTSESNWRAQYWRHVVDYDAIMYDNSHDAGC